MIFRKVDWFIESKRLDAGAVWLVCGHWSFDVHKLKSIFSAYRLGMITNEMKSCSNVFSTLFSLQIQINYETEKKSKGEKRANKRDMTKSAYSKQEMGNMGRRKREEKRNMTADTSTGTCT